MRIQTFIIGSALALAVFLFGQRYPAPAQPAGFSRVVDLTHAINDKVPTYEPEQSSSYQVKTLAKFDKLLENILDAIAVILSEI